MARPRKYDPGAATDSLMETFWRDGFEATSLADLMAATGLKKGSLYAAFGDKRAMYLRSLAAYDAKYVDTAVSMMAHLHGTAALEALLRLPAQAVATRDRRGCFLCNASMESAALDDAAKTLVQSSQKKLLDAIQSALTEAQADGESIHGLQANAHQILALYFGLRVLARSGVSAARIRAAAQL